VPPPNAKVRFKVDTDGSCARLITSRSSTFAFDMELFACDRAPISLRAPWPATLKLVRSSNRREYILIIIVAHKTNGLKMISGATLCSLSDFMQQRGDQQVPI
jgi:hypothetical protein